MYRIDPSGHEKAVYRFNGNGGCDPVAGVIRDSAGNLYGTGQFGGTANAGVVYRISAGGTETVLYNFMNGSDGGYPVDGVIRDSAGNLYGTVPGGSGGSGVLYKLDPDGNYTILYNFCRLANCVDGSGPVAGVIRDSAGNLYGATLGGGAGNYGVVYKLNPAGKYAVLYNFCSLAFCADGGQPSSGLILDSAGNLYGATSVGGYYGYDGTIYKLSKSGKEAVIYSFTDEVPGSYPNPGLIRDVAGNFYGTAPAGFAFEIDSAGNEILLHSFTGGVGGADVNSGLIRDTAGNLYGTTSSGGAAGQGVVYKLDATGNETLLYTFPAGKYPAYPIAGVVSDAQGNFYGTAFPGTVEAP